MDEVLKKAVAALREEKVILYPTDSVWGIGCDATDEKAVARIFEIKKRADSKSLVLLADSLDMICRYVEEIPGIAEQLVEVNDKPMTIIYPGAIVGAARRGLAANTVAEDGSVGIRIPLGGFCKELVRRFGRPIVSTSANISGEPTPKRYSDITPAILSAVDFSVEASLETGATTTPSQIIKVGLDSTIQIIRR